MKRLLLCTATLAGLWAAGCRSNGKQDLLERELRLQEDRIYHLQGHVQDYQQQLACLQGENDALRGELARWKPSTQPVGELPPVRPAAPYRTPQILPPGGGVLEGQPAGRLPPGAPPGAPSEMPLAPPKIELPPGSSSDARQAPVEIKASQAIAALSFNSQLTGGYDQDRNPGDDGVAVCIEPRGPSGEIIQWHGPLSVVLMDPSLEGDAARVARWDLGEDDVAAHFHRGPGAAGIQFELPWPTGVPAHRQLKLFARHATPDGRKLDASQDVEIIRPGEHVRRWTRSAHNTRVQTVPIDDVRPLPEQAPSEPETAGEPATREPADTQERPPATARRPHWTPYR